MEPTPVVSTLTSVGVTQPNEETVRLSTKAAPTGTVIRTSSTPTPSGGSAIAVTPTPTKTWVPTSVQHPSSGPTATPTSRAATIDAMAPSGFVIPEPPDSNCIPGDEGWPHRKLLKWTSDGTKIVFDHGDEYLHSFVARYGQAVYVAEADGSQVQRVAEGSLIFEKYARPSVIGHMMYFDVSRDGSRVVYSTCRHGPLSADPQRKGRNEEYQHNYEIKSVNIDGTDLRRLTSNSRMDNYPVWSPDGTRIAFIRDIRKRYSGRGRTLFTMAPDGSEARPLTLGIDDVGIDDVAMRPPVWSPNGDYLAFVGEDDGGRWDAIYTVRADGSGLTRVSDTVSAPSWSPDGTRLAFAAIDGEGVSLFIATPDGSDRVKVVPIMEDVVYLYVYHQTYYSATFLVSWSPAGDHIMYLCEPSKYTAGVCIVSSSGTPVGESPEFEYFNHRGNIAEWSPDGSRIAVRTLSTHDNGVFLYTMAPDGSDVKHLIGIEEDSEGRHLKMLNPSTDSSP